MALPDALLGHVLAAAGPERADAKRAVRDLTTVVVADDHAAVRQVVRLLIDGEEDLRVVAEAGTVPDAERLTYAHRPTVLVLDLNMPGGSSLAAIPRLLTHAPATAIVVLTMQDDPAFARQALRAGALGYVLKEAADEELRVAIRLAAAGDTYLGPGLAAHLAADAFPVSR
jgi:two-component system response regulator NreC